MTDKPVKILIGSGEQSLLERKVLLYSIHKHTKRELDIYIYNGTHNSIERNDDAPYLSPMSLKLKYRNLTEFSMARFIVPEVCGHKGKCIFFDSDMICLGDVGELFDSPVSDYDFLAKKGALEKRRGATWALSVMLVNCDRCDFDLEKINSELEEGIYSYSDFAQMHPNFLKSHHYKIGEMNPQWNVFDFMDKNTKLLHYTNLQTQPWKYYDHPFGKLWFKYFEEARQAGYISDDNIHLTIMRGNVRKDIKRGNASPPLLKLIRQRYKDKRRKLIHHR